MVLDAHRHFWHYTPQEFGWVADDCLKGDFLPADCANMDACVAVQARQCVEETHWLLDLADRHAFIQGVVGWLPLASDGFDAALAGFAGCEKLVGLRHVVQDEPDDAFILRPDFVRGVRHTLAAGLAYDILVFERHLPNVLTFVDALPDDARLVLDHLGKPHDFASWRKRVRELARRANLFCKLSGLVTEVHATSPDALAPYLDVALEAFGPKRVMFGSDWPVVTAHMPYAAWKALVANYAARLSPSERDAIMCHNAEQFYNIVPHP